MGIGEGPGRPVLEGEQYLAADPPFGADAELLDALRPWMTLDAAPADERSLAGELGSWSCLPLAGFLWVIRLCPAGTFDRRLAYFAHARAWAIAELPAFADPGLLLGRTAAFDRPWRDGRRPASEPEPGLEPLRAQAIATEPAVAARLLASLYHGLVSGRAVLVAVSPEDFAAGASLAELVAFARTALPLRLRQRVKLRLFARETAAFLRLGVNLLVIPEDQAGQALSQARGALLLNRGAEPQVLPGVPDEALAYSETMVRLALDRPDALQPFLARCAPRDDALPTPRQIVSLAVASLPEGARPGDEDELAGAVSEIDRWLQKAPVEAAEGLAASGWWTTWRSRTREEPGLLRRVALTWLTATCWSTPDPPEAPLETWRQVIGDIAEVGLGWHEVKALWAAGRRRWPLIRPFELVQVEDLARCVRGAPAQTAFARLVREDRSLAGLPSGWQRKLLGLPPGDLDAGRSSAPRPPEGAPPPRDLLAEVALALAPPPLDRPGWTAVIRCVESCWRPRARATAAARATVGLALLWRARHGLEPGAVGTLAEALRTDSRIGRRFSVSPFLREVLPMHERVTFFFRRRPGSAEPSLLEANLDGQPAQALVWVRRPRGLDAGRGQRERPGGDRWPSVEELSREVSESGGGMVVAALAAASADVELRLRIIADPGFEPARQALLLSPGASPARRPLRGERFPLARGQHLLVPVDRESEEELARLEDALGCLPRELSTLIFETIAQPSLDYRLSVLEERSSRPAGLTRRAGAGPVPSRPQQVLSFLARPVPVGRLLAALALALAVALGAAALVSPIVSYLAASERRIRAVEEAVGRVGEKLGVQESAPATSDAGTTGRLEEPTGSVQSPPPGAGEPEEGREPARPTAAGGAGGVRP